MPQGIKALNLRFLEEKFERLKEKRDASGSKSWEEYILMIAGMPEDE
jgi:hypothetical protein